MHMRHPRGAATSIAILVCLVGAPRPAAAQQPPDSARADSLRARVRALEARVDSLLALLRSLQTQGPTSRPAEGADELAALRAAAGQAAGQAAPAPADTGGRAQSHTRNLNVLNPEISVTGDLVGNFTAPDGGPDNTSFTPREFELSIESALDPYTRAKVFVTREEPFQIAGQPTEAGGGDFEIEEGYMYWVGLPGGLGARLGKFRQDIGLYNRWHTHALLEVERPLATAAFLGDDGLIQTGASATLPSVTAGQSTETFTLQAARGDNETLFEGGNELSYLGRAQSFWDLGPASYVQVGATGVYGENDSRSLVSRLLELDLSYRWSPPGQTLYREFTARAEWYFAKHDFGQAYLSGNGGYLQLSYRLNRRWILGTRLDRLDPLEPGPRLTQLVPSLTFWQSEWVRMRLQYNLLHSEAGRTDHTLLFQTVFAVGPHKHETY
jgi:hypothetical protein